MNTTIQRQAFFLATVAGARFCLLTRPSVQPIRQTLIHVHPFAEEMNKSRRMVALQASALAAAGCAVLQIDLLGCGDSAGDFSDASWAAWQDDVLAAAAWLRRQSWLPDAAPLWLWGLRAGALLASTVAARLAEPVGLLLWQPVVSGRQHMQQFLRLKAAAAMLDERADPPGVAVGANNATGLRQQLQAGHTVEVAGYTLSPGLVLAMDEAELQLADNVQRVIWLELQTGGDEAPALLPVSQRRLEAWQSSGRNVRAQAVTGAAFWMTSEIHEAPELIAATTAALSAVDAGPMPPAARVVAC